MEEINPNKAHMSKWTYNNGDIWPLCLNQVVLTPRVSQNHNIICVLAGQCIVTYTYADHTLQM